MSVVTNFFPLLSCCCFKASSTLKGCTFSPFAFTVQKILISEQILVLSLLVFIQKDHVVIAVKDALSRYTPPVPEEYYKVLHTCNTFRCSQLITILQYIQYVCIIQQYTYYYTTYVQYIILIILQYSRCFRCCHCVNAKTH